jgi:hypothetical protein
MFSSIIQQYFKKYYNFINFLYVMIIFLALKAIFKRIGAEYFQPIEQKGISAHQVHRMLSVTYKTAWFMMHRIRCAMNQDLTVQKLSGIVEIDDGFIGGIERGYKGKRETKTRVMFLVSREGKTKSQIVDTVSAQNVKEVLNAYINTNSILYTDGFLSYCHLQTIFKKHIAVIGTK